MTVVQVSSTTLEALLTKYREREWFFVRPGGNLGDELIYSGAESLADRLGLRRQRFDSTSFATAEVPRGAAIYLHGGGGLNPWSSGRAYRNLGRAIKVRDALVVQGPQTCEVESTKNREILRATLAESCAQEIHIFAREQVSADYLQTVLADSVQLHLDNDTALQLTQMDLLRLGGLDSRPASRYVLLVNRRDDEAPQAGARRFRNVVDMDPAYYARTLGQWIRIHACASRIITNRLHSAIGGSLLGIPVLLTGGSYHKNHSVWEYSLRQLGVEWRDSFDDELTVDDAPLRMPNWLANSWKVQRLMMRLRGVPA